MNLDLEKQILAAFMQDRGAYEKVAALVSPADFTEVGRIIFQAIQAYYDKDQQAAEIDRALLSTKVARKYKKQAAPLQDFLAAFPAEVSTANTLEEILSQRKVITEARLGNALMNPSHTDREVREGIEQWLAVEDLRESLGGKEADPHSEILAPTAQQFMDNPIEMMPLFPAALNKLTGGIGRGMNMVVFARFEVGKTGFAINLGAGWVKKGYRVCHIVNEEDIRVIFTRYLARLQERPFTLKHLQEPESLAETLVALEEQLGRLYVKRMDPGSAREIEAVIKKFKPDAIIVDQLINLNEKSMEGLAKSSSMLRSLGGHHGVTMVPLTQADEAADGRIILGAHNIFMSKTAVQGDADILVGLGADASYVSMNKLHINVLKDKVPGGGHGHFPVTIDRSIGKLISHK